MSAPLLLAGRNAPNVKTMRVRVPAGHVLPGGETVVDPFDLTVQAGARWHPDWDRPRYSVIAYRLLAMGDAIGFTGKRARAFPLPDWMDALAYCHGQAATPGLAINTEGNGELFAPYKPERIADFIPPRQVLN